MLGGDGDWWVLELCGCSLCGGSLRSILKFFCECDEYVILN